MITDAYKLATALMRGLQNLVAEGETDNLIRRGNELFWPFDVQQVEGMHSHKIGYGDGVWFRLKDGRVFNRFGEETDPDPALYDTVEN